MCAVTVNHAPLPSAEAAEPSLLQVRGQLDRRNFQQLITDARHAYQQGVRRLRIDLSDSPSIAVAGLVGLFAVAELFDGRCEPDCSDGWGAIHQMLRSDAGSGGERAVELAGLRPGVVLALERAGLLRRFEVAPTLPVCPMRLAA